MPIEKNQILTLNDGSQWNVTKIFDTWQVKDKLYKAMTNQDGRYQYHLQGNHSAIIMSEEQLTKAMEPK